MGGDVRNARTEEPTTKSTCEVCERSFEHKYKYSRTVCNDCNQELNTVENLTPTITTEINPSTSVLTVTVESNVNENIPISIPTTEVEQKHIIGVLRVEGDNGAWYEDAWIEIPPAYDISVRHGEYTVEFTYPISESIDSESVRNEYQSSSGNLTSADCLTAEFTFTAEGLGSVSTTTTVSDYYIELED